MLGFVVGGLVVELEGVSENTLYKRFCRIMGRIIKFKSVA